MDRGGCGLAVLSEKFTTKRAYKNSLGWFNLFDEVADLLKFGSAWVLTCLSFSCSIL